MQKKNQETLRKRSDELERRGLVEPFGLKKGEVFEARHNLLGFFGVLYRINQRLRTENKDKEEELLEMKQAVNK